MGKLQKSCFVLLLSRCFSRCTSNCPQYFVSSGYRNHDKKKSHKYDPSKSRLRKKAGGREKETGGSTRRGGNRASSQRPSRSHSDEEEDEGVPASYHTVSLQVSQDVSTAALFTLLPFIDSDSDVQQAHCRF